MVSTKTLKDDNYNHRCESADKAKQSVKRTQRQVNPTLRGLPGEDNLQTERSFSALNCGGIAPQRARRLDFAYFHRFHALELGPWTCWLLLPRPYPLRSMPLSGFRGSERESYHYALAKKTLVVMSSPNRLEMAGFFNIFTFPHVDRLAAASGTLFLWAVRTLISPEERNNPDYFDGWTAG